MDHIEIDRARGHSGSLRVDPAHERKHERRSRRRADQPRLELVRYFHRFSDILRSAHAPAAMFDALRDEFSDARTNRERLPCPHCFMGGHSGRMATLAFTGHLHAVRCRHCGSTVVVETGV